MMVRIWSVVFVLVVAACTSTPPPLSPPKLVHDCSERLSTPLGEFGATTWHFYWFTPRGDGPRIQLGYRLDLEGEGGGGARLFKGLQHDPELHVGFDERFRSWNWLRGRYNTRTAEARIGDEIARSDVSATLSVHFNHGPTQEMLANEGDLEVTLRDETGAVLQSATVPHSRLLAIEQTFRELQTRLQSNLSDKEHRCQLVPEPVIIV